MKPTGPALVVALAFCLVACSVSPPEPAQQPAAPTRSALAPASPSAEREGEREGEKGEKGESPLEAFGQRQMQLADEAGRIAPAGYSRAIAHLRAMRARPQRAAGLSRTSWVSRGPGNIGGRVRALVIHPTNPATMWAGGTTGGVWKTTDGGASWRPLDDFLASLAVSQLVLDPLNANVLYAATGETYGTRGIRGAGIFKSADGGETWALLPATDNADFTYVTHLSLSADGKTLLATTIHDGWREDLWRSGDGGQTWEYKQTTDRVYSVQFSPSDASRAVALGDHGPIYTADGGQTWQRSSAAPLQALLSDNGRIAYARSNPAVVYLSAATNEGELWRSADGGKSFARVSTGAQYLGGASSWAHALWVDPTNPNIVVLGGLNLYRSTDGGKTLTWISAFWWGEPGSQPSGLHPDQQTIVAHPNFNGSTNTTVFIGNDGGVYRADDIYSANNTQSPNATSWRALNNGLGITQFYGAAALGDLVVGGTQDNGMLAQRGATAWRYITGGDGGFVAIDPQNPSYIYGEYQRMVVYRSTNGGQSVESISAGLGDSQTCSLFIAPLMLDPNAPQRLLAGGCSLWRSDDARTAQPQWRQISQHFPNPISAIAVTPGNSDEIWVGTRWGELYKTSNGTADAPTWTQIDPENSVLPRRYIARILLVPGAPTVAYLAYGGFSPGNIKRSADGGATWADVTGSGDAALPEVPVRALAANPRNAAELYAGTEVGVFASADGGAHWDAQSVGPASVSVEELSWDGDILVAATHGRGIFTADLSAPPPPSATATPTATTSPTASPSPTATGTASPTPLPTATRTPQGAPLEWRQLIPLVRR